MGINMDQLVTALANGTLKFQESVRQVEAPTRVEAVDLEMAPDVKESLEEDVKESEESEADIPEAHERLTKKTT